HDAYPQTHNLLGAALKSLQDADGAEAAFRRAFELDPTMTAAQVNLGTVYGMRRQWDAALACYERALAISPNSAEALNNRGNVRHSVGQFAAAQADFERAIAIDPDYPDPHLNLGLQLLMQGRWAEGWPEFEWRWRTPQMEPFRRDFPQPQWDGTPMPDATLLVHAEQGMGDTLNFVRYAPLAAERVGRVVLESQPSLVPLLRGMAGVDHVFPRTEAPPAFDVHVPLLSLPGIFGTKPETVPDTVPYLHAPAEATARLPAAGPGLKVGLVWAGNPRNPFDPSRTAGLRRLRPLFDVPGCVFYSLQHGPPGDQIAAEGLGGRIHDLRAQLTDFAATAALVDQLDLVISICTSVAHLAGGMGAETWVTLSQDADWRWLRDTETSPWYPSVRLFRQRELDDWDELAGRVAVALAERAIR
ncbi:MAG: tetratricopeptide repeat protein, partial [Rhodospirillaceae bacterium]